MKAISVRQPFAEFINGGQKTIELRSWQTDYRGDIVICSSKTGDKTWLAINNEYHLCPMGTTICKAKLIDCRPAIKDDALNAYCHADDITDDIWAWVLDDVVDLIPQKVIGKLRLFDVKDELIQPCGDVFYDEFYEKGTPNFEKDYIITVS